MAERFAIYQNGWGGEIFASHLKNGSWSITFEIGSGEYGTERRTVRNIRSPKQFVYALYNSDGFEMDPQQVEKALAALFENAQNFAVACSIFTQMEDGETDFDEEEYLYIFPTFLSSAPHLPSNFIAAKQIAMKLFAALIECKRKEQFSRSLEIDEAKFSVVWNNRISDDLREFLISKAINEHCRKSEWKKLSGHSHAAIGNGQIGQKIRKFVAGYLDEYGNMPIGEFLIEGTPVKFI